MKYERIVTCHVACPKCGVLLELGKLETINSLMDIICWNCETHYYTYFDDFDKLIMDDGLDEPKELTNE